MTNETKADAGNQIDEALIAEYLQAHPDFFVDRNQLLLEMALPHSTGGAVSLVERQVSLLRERQLESKKKLEEFVVTARQNDAIFRKTQKLILSLVEAKTTERFFEVLEESFRRDFQTSAYSLIAFDDDAKQHNHFTTTVSETAAREYIAAIMKRRKPTLGVLRDSERDFLFRHQSNRVSSAVIIPIGLDNKTLALLAIGSDDKAYFNENMGTEFIGFIADVLSRLLPAHIGLK